MKKLVTTLVVLSMQAFAVDSNLYLLHINGLNTMPEKAFLHKDKYISVASVSSNPKWATVYNPTQSGDEWGWVASIKGFIDVCMQKWFGHEELPSLDEMYLLFGMRRA